MPSGEFRFKCFRLFFPVIGLAVGLAVAYSLVNWLLVAGTGYLPLDEQLVDDWLPLGIAIILVIVWVGPAIKKLRFKSRRRSAAWYIAIAAVAAPVIFTQNYVVRASGTLTHVADAAQIASGATTKYYSAGAICIDHGNALAETLFEGGASRNETLLFHIYIAAPLCGEDIRAPGQKTVWIGLVFSESVDGRLSVADTEDRYQQFAKRTEHDFNRQNGAHYRFYERAPINAERRSLVKALAKGGISADNAILLIPHTEPFEQRTGHWLKWVFVSLGVGALAWLAMIAIPAADTEGPETPESQFIEGLGWHHGIGWALFVPSRKSWGLPVLLDVNIAVYLAMVLCGLGVASFQNDDLIAWGANYGPLLHGIGLLRLITSQFVHGGLMHLASNMYGLIFAGVVLQPVLRNWGMVTAYLTCGLAGAIMSAVMHPDGASVGASGAIMGLWGIVLVLAMVDDPRISEGRAFVLINAALFVGLTLVTGFAQPGIDNAAHLGGVVMGALIGAALFFTRDRHAVHGHDDKAGAPGALADLHPPRPEVPSSS